ncbi:NUDIX hydrolase [Chitinophaga niabensis]|uniref:GDP-mannose pyrophosphatase n=1 Tax=Chitinophaga niabensis TaxID=536979 RepID=A0A1N6EVT0_9BACT|nr:NUDIX hydrolase [Chitinophaga niabensis]SIN87155.1 NUDIX domain-containing protein [Chitinophaga niabensis]
MEWKLLSSEYLHKEPWLTVRRDKCVLADGRIVDPYYVLEYPDWANAMAVTEDNKVILIRQYRHAVGKVLLEIPGGVIDATDASPETAMKRELLEETGYAFSEVHSLGAVSPNPSVNTNLTHMFLALGGKKVQEQQLDHNEEIEVILVDVAEVEQLLKDHQFLQSLHVSCLFYALQKYRELKAVVLPG